MTTGPLVSIVLPTYNGARYLGQAIQSCLDQTYPHWELIIVDDASTDDTPTLIAQFIRKDGRIRLIRHAQNRILPGALNTGFAVATGEYLTWTSDDNCYRPEALAVMAAFLESAPEYEIVYADYTLIDADGRPVQHMAVRDPEDLVIGNHIGPCFLYRRIVQTTLKAYDESLFLAEDYDFWLRASTSFRLYPLHKDLYLYRLHSGSLTHQKWAQVQRVFDLALESNLCRMDWLSCESVSKGYFGLAVNAYKRHYTSLACVHLWRALRSSPRHVLQQIYELAKRRLTRVTRHLASTSCAERLGRQVKASNG